MMHHCPFCKIAKGEIAAHEVYRDDQMIAFLDRAPIRSGHLQIIPRAHFPCFDDLPPELAGGITKLGQRLAIIQKRLLNVDRVAFLFTGGDIAHAHAHLVPIMDPHDITSRRYIVEEDLTFRDPPQPGDAEQRSLASRLRRAIDG